MPVFGKPLTRLFQAFYGRPCLTAVEQPRGILPFTGEITRVW